MTKEGDTVVISHQRAALEYALRRGADSDLEQIFNETLERWSEETIKAHRKKFDRICGRSR